MLRKLIGTSFIGVTVALTACGGGGGGDSASGGSSGAGTGQAQSVSGPLDTAQSALTSSVVTPLESAAAGTPLAGVISCANEVVNQNQLDLLDAALNGLQNPSSLSTTTPTQVQALLLTSVDNLGSTLSALGGLGSCSSSTNGTVPASNPLAGTQLASFGATLLPELQTLQSQLSSAGTGGTPGLSLSQLSTLEDQLNSAEQSAFSQVPASAFAAPVLGGVLTSLKNSSSDSQAVLAALASQNSTALQTAAQMMVSDTFSGFLTGLVPTSFLDTQAGQPGLLTNPIQAAISQFSSLIGSDIGQGQFSLPGAAGTSQVTAALQPVTQILSTLVPTSGVGPLQTALQNPATGSGGTTGTPLDPYLTSLGTELTGILGTSGTGAGCVFASLPLLSSLCK